MTNVHQKLAAYRDRWLDLEGEKRDRAEDIKQLRTEMASNRCSKDEIAGVALDVKRQFETPERRAKRTAAEHIADMLGASGDAPLFERAAA